MDTDTLPTFKLWSNKHRAWWGWNRWGYTPSEEDAGKYGHRETMEILASSSLDRQWSAEHDVPKTVALGPDGLWYSVTYHAEPDAVRLLRSEGASQ